MAIYRTYNYEMGFAINGEPIPDPAEFSGKESDLDTEGGRDATGTLHRNRVATKHPLKLGYKNITWEMMQSIMSKMLGDKFQFTYPDPRTGVTTITAYCGDRDWDCVMADAQRGYLGNLNFSVIEY